MVCLYAPFCTQYLSGRTACTLSVSPVFFQVCTYTYFYSYGNRYLSCLKSILQLWLQWKRSFLLLISCLVYYCYVIITTITTTTTTSVYILAAARIFNHRTIYLLFPKGIGKGTKYKINTRKKTTVV